MTKTNPNARQEGMTYQEWFEWALTNQEVGLSQEQAIQWPQHINKKGR
jgi:hypothetical protein